MPHPLDVIPDPDPATTLVQSSVQVVTPPNAKDECLAVALKACLEIISSVEYGGRYGRAEAHNNAVAYARKAVELGSKLEQ